MHSDSALEEKWLVCVLLRLALFVGYGFSEYEYLSVYIMSLESN